MISQVADTCLWIAGECERCGLNRRRYELQELVANTGKTTLTGWQIDAGRLAMRLPSGALIHPTASEITGAEFKGRFTVRGENVAQRPSEALPELQFHRYPADVSIEVFPPAPDLSRSPACAIR